MTSNACRFEGRIYSQECFQSGFPAGIRFCLGTSNLLIFNEKIAFPCFTFPE